MGMAGESGSEGLFGELPAQAAPERSGGATPRRRLAERRQVELRAVDLDELIPSDHRVRLVWEFVEGLDLAALHGAIKAVEGRPGHPPADPRILVSLWLYATVKGVGSARELARLCREHIAFQWLCGGVGMNAKTLADFRVTHGAVLERLLVDSFAALLEIGAARLDRVAQDGVRVRAAAGAASFRRHAPLEDCPRAAEAEVERLRGLASDPSAQDGRQAAAHRRAAADRARRVKAALAVTTALKADQQEHTRRRAERAFKEARKRAAARGRHPHRRSRLRRPRSRRRTPQKRQKRRSRGPRPPMPRRAS